MNDADLTRIIEETFQNIIRNDGPSIFHNLSHIVQDISNVTMLQPEQSSFPMPSFPFPTPLFPNPENVDMPETLPHFFHTSSQLLDISNSDHQNMQQNEMLEDFSMRWFQQVNHFHNCMRDYNKNMLQINRITNNLLINIASQRVQPSQNTIEIQGFSIPVRPPTDRHFPVRHSPGISIPIRHSTESPHLYPNISQITASTSLFTYTGNLLREGFENRCPISLEEFEIGDQLCEINHCHHIFKWIHLQSWFCTHSNCPVCRFDIRGT